MSLPFVVMGAAPGLTTGRSRIATDVMACVWSLREQYDLAPLQVGDVPWGPLPTTGVGITTPYPWPVWAYQTTDGDWGKTAAEHAVAATFGRATEGILLMVDDPARMYPLLPTAAERRLGNAWQRWGYVSIDATNRNGTIGGPAAEAIRQLDRATGYSQFGAAVIDTIRGAAGGYIPHGVDRTVFKSGMTEDEHTLAQRLLNPMGTPQPIIGCVATNEARKDLWLFVEVIALLRKVRDVRGWLHVDREVAEAWSVPQLVTDAGLDWTNFTVTTPPLSDRTLATMYAQSAVTIAVGRGEAFGYPIVESLACGTPAIHVGGSPGSEITEGAWVVAPTLTVASGQYGLARPVLSPFGVAATVTKILDEIQDDWKVVRDRAVHRSDRYDRARFGTQMISWLAEGLEPAGGR